MVNESRNASTSTPSTDRRTSHAEPNSASLNITLAELRVERAIQFDDFEASDQDSEEDGRDDDNDSVGLKDEAEERSPHVVHSSNLRGLLHAWSTSATNKKMEDKT